MSIELIMLSNHLMLCPTPTPTPSPPTLNLSQYQGLSNESTLCIRWPKYWRFSFSISPSSEYSSLISFRIDSFHPLAVKGTLLFYYHQEAFLLVSSSVVKNLPAMLQTWVWSLGWENLLEKKNLNSNSRKSHAQRSLAGSSPWNYKESNMT